MSNKWLTIDWLEMGLIPIVIAGILALMAMVRFSASKFGIAPEIQRKTVHVSVGIASLFFLLVFSGPLPVFILIACTIAIMLAMRRRKVQTNGIGSVIHSVSRPSYGEIYLALSIAFLFFRSADNPVLYVLPLLVVTLSDTASALIGTSYGRLRFAVKDGTKSIEGVVAFFTVTWMCAMIVLLLMSDTARLNVIIISFLIAAFCALVEADSWRGLDNLFVPVGAHLLLERYMNSEPLFLLMVALGFVFAVVVAIKYARIWGITSHSARSYTIMLFLLLSVTDPINVILPVAVIIAHIATRNCNPCRSITPDLDLLAAITGVGLLWLLAGEAIEVSAINLFNITFAAAAVVFATLATTGKDTVKIWRYALIPVGILLAILCTFIVQTNPSATIWSTPAWPSIIIAIALSLGIAYFKSNWFATWRSPKAFGVALIVPIILFLADGAFS